MKSKAITPENIKEFTETVVILKSLDFINRIRKKLLFNEDDAGSHFISGFENAKSPYLYRVLDEVEKLLMNLIGEQKEFLSSQALPPQDNEQIKRLTRITLSQIFDKQNLYLRKLLELYTEVLLFKQVNKNEYYKLYLLIDECNSLEKYKKDLFEFYACDNKNVNPSLERYNEDISNLKNSLDLSNFPNPEIRFKKKYKKALLLASDAEKFSLGLSYYRGFGTYSGKVHRRITGAPDKPNYKLLEAHYNYLAMLAQTLILACYELLDNQDDEEMNNLITLLKSNPGPTEQMKKYIKPEIEIGDFVICYDDLAEVIGIHVSPYGYRSFEIRYLKKPPLPEIIEDCFPAEFINLILKKDLAETAKQKAWEELSRHNNPSEKEKLLAEALIDFLDVYVKEKLKQLRIKESKN